MDRQALDNCWAPAATVRIGTTSPIRPEDAFLVQLMTRDALDYDPCIDNGSVWSDLFRAGITSFHDVNRDSIAEIHCPAGCLSFYLPRSALDEIAAEVDERRVRVLYFRYGRVFHDPVMRSLCQALLPELAKPDQLNSLFIDHIGRALRAHIARVCGAMPSTPPPVRGGLAPWQERRARDILSNNLNGELTLAQVARECGLSVSHFTRAFRQSLGVAPHQWLLRLRVDRAKERLLISDASLADVAVECGFADQSHFTRVFTKQIGASPGQWRRRFASGPIPDAGAKERNRPFH
jgi:AraC family transcriptional regulator